MQKNNFQLHYLTLLFTVALGTNLYLASFILPLQKILITRKKIKLGEDELQLREDVEDVDDVDDRDVQLQEDVDTDPEQEPLVFTVFSSDYYYY